MSALLADRAAAQRNDERIQRQAAADLREADVDSFVNWLYGHCQNVDPRHCVFGYIPSDPVRLMQFVETLDVPQMVAALRRPERELVFLAARRLSEMHEEQS